jgi:hypothetical protein
MYAYGDQNPEIASLLRERSFQHLVGGLFRSEEATLPSEPPLLLQDAVRLDLLASSGTAYRAGRRLVLIPAAAEREVAGLLRPALESYVAVAARVKTDLLGTYTRTAVAEQFPWSRVSHSILAGLFLDLAMGLEVFRSGIIARPPSGDTVIWAFQGVSAENAYGVCSIPAASPRRAHFGELWHHRARRSEPRLGHSHVALMIRCAHGEQGPNSPKDLLYLKYLGLVRKAGDSLQLQVPAFGTADTEQMLAPLTEGARRLVTEAIIPSLELLEHHPWWRQRVHHEAYRHAAIRLILEHGIDAVIASGACDPFPEAGEVSVEWGRWLWEEPDGPRTVMPHLAASRGQSTAR